MHPWNVIISIRDGCYRDTRQSLKALGAVERTGFYNVLALTVDDVPAFLEALRAQLEADAGLRRCLARVIPVTHSFTFQSPQEFEARARETVETFVDALGGKRFYVRMHRRGFRAQLSSQDEERMLDRFLLDHLQDHGAPGQVAFDDPDAVLDIETVGQWAGLALWRRDELRRYPFIRAD
jgi:tRNA(Ser,Leu) C12 N-acetylase TAN1